MAEQDKPKVPPEGAASSMASSSISDTISELLQNPAQVDIATTLGLLDDPSNPIAGGDLDTSAMLDPSSFLQSPSTVVSSATQTVTGTGTTDPLSIRKSVTTSSSSPSKSLEAISSRLLQSISSSVVSSEKGPSVTLAQKSPHLASGSGSVAVDAPSKVTTAPPTLPTSGDTMADLTSIINSIVSREQQAVATVLTSSSTLSQPQSTMTSSPGSIPNPIPIPSATHIPHSVGASAQGSTEQKSSVAKQKESIMHVSMAIPSLGDLCKSLGVNISKESPPFRASTPATSLSSTPPTTAASLPPTAAVGKTEKEASAPVIDHSTAPKVDSSVSTVSVSDEAKKLKSADSAVGKPAVVIPNSFLAAIQLQPASSPQKSSPTQTADSSQPQAITAPPPQKTLIQSLPTSGAVATATSLAPSSALPASITAGKNAPLQTKTTSESIGVQASNSQSQIDVQKAILIGSLASQKQHGSTKTVSTANVTPAVATQTTTKSSPATVSRQIPTPSATNTTTPPTVTPTTGVGAVTIKSQQQAAGSSVQVDNSSAATTTPKDINLPILQFLQANFPALQLGGLSASGGGSGAGKGKREGGGGGGGGGDGSSKEVLQVQTLLAHVLQQQQQLQQLQQQAQQQVQKAIASGQPLAAPGNTGKANVYK